MIHEEHLDEANGRHGGDEVSALMNDPGEESSPRMASPEPGVTSERYRTLLEINNALISNLTQEALFHAIAGALRRVVPFERTAIFLHDPEKDVLKLFILQSSLPTSYFTVGLELPRGESHVGWVFQNQRALRRSDLATEREYPAEDLAHRDGIRSYVMVPLIARGTSIGALAVASTQPHQYSEADARFLQEAANQVALAVENMKAYEQLTALNARATATAERNRVLLEINNAIITHRTRDALFHATIKSLRRVLAFDHAALTLHDPRTDELRVVAMEGRALSDQFGVGVVLDRGDSYCGWAFDHQRPLVRVDIAATPEYSTRQRALAAGIRSLCMAPLILGGRSIGTLNVSSATAGRYSDAEAELVQEVANQVALAVDNMTAYEEIAALKARLEHENVYLQEEIRHEHNFVEMVGNSPALLAALRKVEQVAATDSTVLISGETGTGKELIARAIHSRSPRKDRPLVKVNCAAISAGLVESELFGHVKGAFTGAIDRRVGRFELADGGTIFLDEVGELAAETQVKLLRVLQEQEFEPVGSSRTVRVDVRVIAASNRNLEEAVASGRFRADLFYRLNVFPLEVPPLRERRSDIPQLVMFFLAQFAKKFGKRLEAVPQPTMDRLLGYSWPGNIRELQNIIERATVLTEGTVLMLDHDLVPPARASGRDAVDPPPGQDRRVKDSTPGQAPPRLGTLEEVERSHILTALEQTGWLVEGPKGAARILALHPNTLRSRMEKLGIKRPAHGMS
jgi:formate hydrogenlyase transcriptional activator